jgi:hypothetical protein
MTAALEDRSKSDGPKASVLRAEHHDGVPWRGLEAELSEFADANRTPISATCQPFDGFNEYTPLKAREFAPRAPWSRLQYRDGAFAREQVRQ